jgi:predicted SAM-dependent methyltransferase
MLYNSDMNKKPLILDLGCGNKKRLGAVGVDFNDRTVADVLHDLNMFPYPFEDASVDYVYLDNTLEHLDNVVRVMEEIYRIVKPGGTVKVIVPYFRSLWAFIDPTHRHFFTVNSFAFYDPTHVICQRYDYTLARFKTEKILFNETLKSSLFKHIMVLIANRWPWRYEYHLSHLYPLDDITYYLRRL